MPSQFNHPDGAAEELYIVIEPEGTTCEIDAWIVSGLKNIPVAEKACPMIIELVPALVATAPAVFERKYVAVAVRPVNESHLP